MKDRQFHIYLDDEEYGQVLQALIALKSNLIAQGRYTDAVDDVLMYINCLWVSGSFKGHGYSSDLLSECIKDSKEKIYTGVANENEVIFLELPEF